MCRVRKIENTGPFLRELLLPLRSGGKTGPVIATTYISTDRSNCVPTAPTALVILYLLIQNRICLPGLRDSLLYFYFSRTRHLSCLFFIPTIGPTHIFYPLSLLPLLIFSPASLSRFLRRPSASLSSSHHPPSLSNSDSGDTLQDGDGGSSSSLFPFSIRRCRLPYSWRLGAAAMVARA